MFNWLFKSQPTLSEELTSFVKQMGQTAKTLEVQSQAFSKLGPTIMNLVSSESPNYQIFFEKIVEIYANLSRYYSRSAKDVERALEDLKDIDQRYVVVKRIEGERATIKAAFDIVSDNCDNAYKLMNPEKPETVSNYEKAFQIRKEAAQKLFDADNNLLQYNKKFHLFTIRRIKSAWSLYGKALTNLYTLEAGAYSELSTLYKAIRDHSKDPEKILNALKLNVPPAIFEKMLNPQTKQGEVTDESNIEQLLENIVIPPIPNYIKNGNDVIMEIPRTSPKEMIKKNLEEAQNANKKVFSDDEDFKAKIPSDDEDMKRNDEVKEQIHEEVVQLSDDEEFSKNIERKKLNDEEEMKKKQKEEEEELQRKKLEEEEMIRKENEERIRKEEEEKLRKQQEEEERLRKEEEERRKKEEEEMKKKQEEEERIKKEEEERLRKEEEERKKKEEEERIKKEEEERRKKEEEERLKQEEEKKKLEEEQKKKEAEEAEKRRQEEERIKKEEEEKRLKTEEEERLLKEEEEKKKKEAEEAEKKKQEELEKLKQEEEKAKLEEEAKIKKQQEEQSKTNSPTKPSPQPSKKNKNKNKKKGRGKKW